MKVGGKYRKGRRKEGGGIKGRKHGRGKEEKEGIHVGKKG